MSFPDPADIDWNAAAIRKRSINLKGHSTSFSLEPAFFDALQKIAGQRTMPLAQLVADIDTARPENINLSSALRLYVLACRKQAAQ